MCYTYYLGSPRYLPTSTYLHMRCCVGVDTKAGTRNRASKEAAPRRTGRQKSEVRSQCVAFEHTLYLFPPWMALKGSFKHYGKELIGIVLEATLSILRDHKSLLDILRTYVYSCYHSHTSNCQPGLHNKLQGSKR